jgi:hypothetical protein
MTRLTAACPADLIADANHLAMCLGQSAADGLTYGTLGWQDSDGNTYAAASFLARPEWIAGATQPLTRPAWDTEGIIDMDAAARAQAALVVWLGGDEPVPQAAPGAITVAAGDDGLAAMAAMGLVQVASDD